MNSNKPFTCAKCGSPVTGGMLCESCVSLAPQAPDLIDEKPKSEVGKVIVCLLLLLIVVSAVAFGAKTYKSDLANAHAKVAERQEKLRQQKIQQQPDAPVTPQAPPAQSPSPAYQPPEFESTYTPPAPTYSPPSTYTPPVDEHPICNYCHGIGAVDEDCGKCDGFGELECDHCEVYDARLNRGSDPNCPECGGKSHRANAKGSRAFGVAFFYTCPKCLGTKQTKSNCPVCHGLGHT